MANRVVTQDELKHWGILGMHWGLRRFQKEDGTRTPAGKKRDVINSEDHDKTRENRSKTMAGLSNDELRKVNERLQLESVYNNLTAVKIQKAESFVMKTLKASGGSALSTIATGVFIGAAKILIQKLSPTFAEAAFAMKPVKKP